MFFKRFFSVGSFETMSRLPECPPVSTAVPNSSTYSVRDACSRHMDPIHPPAFTNTHCKSSSGRMWPGYFFRSSTTTLEKACSWSWPYKQMGWVKWRTRLNACTKCFLHKANLQALRDFLRIQRHLPYFFSRTTGQQNQS